ncbi:MAG: hypothetical protein ACRDXX_08235, partial [Stackebrandtia sp.]
MTYPPPGPGTGPDPSGYGRQQPQYPDQGSPWARPSQPGGYPDDPASGVPGGYPNQPASGIPGYPQQPTSGFPGGYPGTPMSGVPMSGTPMSGVPVPQQPKSHAALITSLALGFVGLLGLGVVLYFVVGDDEDNTEPRADASATSDEPTDPEPGDTETEETTTGEKLSYTEYADDWEFQLDDVELDATYVNGWDYDGCAEFEADAAFTDLGCEYGVELAYEAEEGDLIVSHLIMGMT